MEIVTAESEELLVEMLQKIQESPGDWLSLHVNISTLRDQMLDEEGLSRKLLAKIRKISMELAQKLVTSGLDVFDGKIMVFEDGDVLALVLKRSATGLGKMLADLRRDFTKSGMIHILAIDEMKDRLAQLIVLSKEKKHTAQDYRLKRRAVEIGESLLEFVDPNPEVASAIQGKRRARTSSSVLVIEDDLLMRGLVVAMLKDSHHVIQAKDAESGVIAYIDAAPNVVFLDIRLPGLNGHETLKRLMKIDPEAYVVMLSGLSSADNVMSTRSAGAAGFLCKPFPKEKLRDYIKQCPSLRSASG